MRISKIIRRDGFEFESLRSCEHCHRTYYYSYGYEETYYHCNVIPGQFCPGCKRKRDGSISPCVPSDGFLLGGGNNNKAIAPLLDGFRKIGDDLDREIIDSIKYPKDRACFTDEWFSNVASTLEAIARTIREHIEREVDV